MFNATVRTKFDHPSKQAEHLAKHEAAAKKKLGAEVTMLTSTSTSHPRDDGGHDVELVTTWGIAKPYAAPATPPHPDLVPHPSYKSPAQPFADGHAFTAPKAS